MPLYYFAYGSNMDPDQMRERCPDAEAVGPARLRDHALAFGGHSPHWEGSPATVVPDADREVPGMVYELPYRDLKVLDHFEGHPVRYERRTREVVVEDGRRLEAQVYIKDVDGRFGSPPESYLSVLRQAYRELGFDEEALQNALHRADIEANDRN